VFPLKPEDFKVRDEDQPHFTRGRNAMVTAFITVPVLIILIVAGYLLRAHWLWIVGAVVLALGNLAPAIRAGVERRQRRRDRA
jgi:Flp pilus assembly protein TadB